MSDPLTAAAAPVSVGSVVGHYRVVRLLGEGGMGLVFEAVHNEIGRRAAIKILHPEATHNPDVARRFLNEARAITQINHPGVVSVFDFGRLPDGRAYLVMEFLDGQTLGDRLRLAGAVQEPVALRWAHRLALALAATHARGIVHRDLKPANIMLVPDPERPGDDRAKVLDFGIAKVGPLSELGPTRMTRTHTIMGTAPYMAPEQCRGSGLIDDRTDVYALGIILFELLTGKPPFRAAEEVEIMTLHLRAAPPPLRYAPARCGPAVAALVESMLAKDPAARPAMAAVAETLESLLAAPVSDPGWRRRDLSFTRHWPWLAAAAAAGVVGLGALAFLSLRGPTRPPAAPPGAALAVQPAAPHSATIASTPTPAPARSIVRWHLSSHPPGAEVLSSRGQVLGRTPLLLERQVAQGKAQTERLRLRLRDHRTQEITLDLSQDETRHVVLPPISNKSLPVLDL